jgi:DNA polymerase III psi subunit
VSHKTHSPEPPALLLLYKEKLYQLNEGEQIPLMPGVKSTQKALIVLPAGDAEPGSASGQLLDKMLAAVGLDRSGCRMVDLRPGLSFRHLQRETDFPVLMAFGAQPAELDLHLQVHSCSSVAFRNCRLIFCPALGDLQNDTAAKKRLWEAMKASFPSS